jgi:hypothetical protein
MKLTNLAGLPFAENVNEIGAGFEGRNGGEIRRTGVPEIFTNF